MIQPLASKKGEQQFRTIELSIPVVAVEPDFRSRNKAATVHFQIKACGAYKHGIGIEARSRRRIARSARSFLSDGESLSGYDHTLIPHFSFMYKDR